MNKLEKIDQEEQKAREKLASVQALLKQIDGKRTEQENLQIVQQIRALKLSREELYAFLGGGALPSALTDMITGVPADAETETIYSRRDRKRRHERQESESEPVSEPLAEESEERRNEE